jgi:uncharacterized membrane-anchored protein YhcB (DUF1043 family)
VKKTIQWLALAALGWISFSPMTVLADSSAAEDQSGGVTGFTYEAIQPENQRDKERGYFDLRMSPGQQQVVQIALQNPGNTEIEVEVALNGAKTNMNGVIEYGPSPIENDASLKYDFVDLVKAPESVKIPPQGETILDITITMPEASFDGMISGGIQMQKKESEEEKGNQAGTAVVNKYAYVVGMVLTETDTVVSPELKLNKVYPELNNYRNSVFINFSNTEAAYLENMSTEVQIMKADSDEVLYDTKKAGMRMAPNTMINFPVSMEGDKMVPGDYRAIIVVTADDRKWEWEEAYSITDEEADKFNKEDVSLLEEGGVNWGIIAAIVGAVVGVGAIIFVIIRLVSNSKKKKGKKKPKKPQGKR